MNKAKTSYRNSLLSFPKIVLKGFLFFGLLLFVNLAIAQSSSHNGGQWRSVGGEMVAAGEGHFSNKWSRATRYAHGDGKYWKNDEPTSNPTTGKKIPATHTPEEVTKDVWSRKGQITVLGPGYLGLFMRSKGAGAVLKFPKSGHVLHAHGMGEDQWLTSPSGKAKWYPGKVVNVDPTNSNATSGWVPAGRTMTLDVWVYNPFSEWGIWGNGYNAPKSVEYEFWFFPRKGGKVIKVAETPVKTGVDNVDDLPPGAAGYIMTIMGDKDGKIVNETTGRTLKKGDVIYFNDILITHNVMVKMILNYPDRPLVVMKSNTKIRLEEREKRQKGGIFNFFGNLFFSDHGKDHNGYKIVTSNAIAGCEDGPWPGEYLPIYRKRNSIKNSNRSSYEVEYNKQTNKTTVTVWKGVVSLKCKNNNNAPPIMVNAGMQATMDNDCNHTLSALGPNNNTPAKAGWDVNVKPDVIDDQPDVIDDQPNVIVKPDNDIVRIAPSSDSYVYAYSYRNWNKANWGKYGSLGAGWHPQGGEKRTYLKFDLSGIASKNVGKATLKLFHYHTGGNNSLSLGIYAVTSPWQEGGGAYHPGQTEKPAAPGEISWVYQPSFNFSPVASFKPGSRAGKYIEVDITPLVMAWLTGKPNYGLMIKPAGIMSKRASESSYGFYSRERQDKEKRPVLILSGSSGPNTQAGTQPLYTDSGTGGGSVGGNLLINPSFEQGKSAGSSYVIVRPGSTDLPGWQITGDSIDVVGSAWKSYHALRAVDIHGYAPGGVKQSFRTTPGKVYRVSFYLAGNPWAGPQIKTLHAEITGVIRKTYRFSIKGKSPQNMGWTKYSFTFQATQSISTLHFFSNGPAGNGAGPVIDNVVVMPASTRPVGQPSGRSHLRW